MDTTVLPDTRPYVLLVTHSPCLDGDSAREVARMGLGPRAAHEVTIDHRNPVAKIAADDAISSWLESRRGEPSTVLFLDTSPTSVMQTCLEGHFARRAPLTVHVGDHHESEAARMRTFQAEVTAMGSDALTVDWGEDRDCGLTLALKWVGAALGRADVVAAVNPEIVEDIRVFDTTGRASLLARFLNSGQTEVPLWAALTADSALHATMRAKGQALLDGLQATLDPLLKTAVVVTPEAIAAILAGLPTPPAPIPLPAPGALYLVDCGDARKATDLADCLWARVAAGAPPPDAVLVMRTGPASASLRHAPGSGLTALAAAQWLADAFGAATRPGGNPGAAGATLPPAGLDLLFAAGRPAGL